MPTITASPSVVSQQSGSTLTVNTAGAIAPYVGGVTPGSYPVYPSNTTTYGFYTVYDGIRPPDCTVTVQVETLVVTEFPDGKVFQRTKNINTAVITVSGTYTGSPGAIDAQIETPTGTVVVPWVTIVDPPSGGIFSGNITVPQGGPYRVRVRYHNYWGVHYLTQNDWWVGAVIVIIGQSNAAGMSAQEGISNTQHTNTSQLLPATDFDTAEEAGYQWSKTMVGVGARQLSYELAEGLGVPVAIANFAVHGSPISKWVPATSDFYAFFATQMAATSNSDFEAVVWVQGEAGEDNSNYETNLANLITQLYTTTGRDSTTLKFVYSVTGIDHGSNDDFTFDIRKAQVHLAQSNFAGVMLGASGVNLPLVDSIVHYNATGHQRLGSQLAKSILNLYGILPNPGTGPKIISVTKDCNCLTIEFHLYAGLNVVLPNNNNIPTAIDFSLNNFNTTISPTSWTKISANKWKLTFTSLGTGSVYIRTWYGNNYDNSNCFMDDNDKCYASGQPVLPCLICV